MVFSRLCSVMYPVITLVTIIALLSAKTSAKIHTPASTILDAKSPICYKIFIVSPICAKSHNHVYSVLAEALAARCHQVTMLISYPVKSSVANVRQLSSQTYRDLSEETFSYKVGKSQGYSVLNTAGFAWEKMRDSASVCERFLADPLTKRLLTTEVEEFDYILFSPHLVEECALAFIHLHKTRFNTPWGFIFSTTAFPWADEAMGNPSLSSSFPVQLLDLSDRMTFSERILNLAFTKFFLWSRLYYSYPRVEAVLRRDYDPSIGSLQQLEKSSTLFLVNIDERVFFYPHVKTPQTIPVGGLHCREPEALPKDLEAWFAGSGDNGVILFSLGTFLKAKDMAMEERDKFVAAFSRLKQRILWRWDGDKIPGLSDNVKLMSWLPQQDVLGHPKTRAFITHGGMLGTQEASYHGVPMIGFPMGADQHLNLVKSVRDGVAVKMDWGNYSAETIVDSVTLVINDPSYKSNVMKRKQLLHDQPESPLQRAVWWIEYLARHRGADDHLRPASRDLEWYQVYMLDIWALVVLIIAVYLAFLVSCCRFLFCCSRGGENKVTSKRQKVSGSEGKKKGFYKRE